jgi:uncharacterized membrane protein YdfJ with MMPL/SSD domain
MATLTQVILALLLMATAFHVQKQVPVFTKGRTRIMIARTILMVVGIAFGLTAAAHVHGHLPQLLAFLIGFGMVNAPAAIVLFIKGKRGEGKS